LALSQSLRPSIKLVRTAAGVQLEWTGPPGDVKR
jgi:hypothetical protein